MELNDENVYFNRAAPTTSTTDNILMEISLKNLKNPPQTTMMGKFLVHFIRHILL